MTMHASIVYDYSGEPVLPERQLPDCEDPMGKIAEKGQFQGTEAEKLSEICGRICYDSFGKGRSSDEYHKHILEVNHGSVYEHFNYTVAVTLSTSQYDSDLAGVFAVLLNRPGIWVELGEDNGEEIIVRVTLNMRATVEWHRWSKHAGFTTEALNKVAQGLGSCIRAIGASLAPHIVILTEDDEEIQGYHFECTHVKPNTLEEKWVSMVVGGSRGFSHELVRHGDRSAISQRSTRYVDEDGSEYVPHPLLTAFSKSDAAQAAMVAMQKSTEADRETYRTIVEGMQPWLIETGVDKFTARKQARGAARGFLGNALYTEMIFSASLAQWHRIFRQRCGMAADAEIREIGCQALMAMKASQYGHHFENWTLDQNEMGMFGVEHAPAAA